MKGYFLVVWVPERPWGTARPAVREQEFQSWMLRELEQVSDRCQPLPPDHWLLDLSGMETCLGPAPAIARQLERRLCEQGLTPRMGMAPTRTAALLAAEAGMAPILDDAPAAVLAALPLSTLQALSDCGPAAAACLDVFARWGLRTLGEVAALPRRALSERLGRAGLACQRWARGDDEGLMLPGAPAPEPAICEQTFEPALEGYLPLLPWLDGQVHAQAAEWERHDRALAWCELALGLEQDRAFPGLRLWQWRYAPPLPHRDARRCLRQLETALALGPPAAPIATARIEFRLLRPRRTQAGLFGDAAVEEENRERLLARLRVLLEDPEGQQCGSPRLRDWHRRDVFAMAPYAPEQGSGARGQGSGGARLTLRARRPAVAIRMEMARLPVQADGFSPVGAMCYLPQPRRIQRAWGPWRCSGAWWSDGAWSRDEWDVEFAPDERYRLLYDRQARRWFLLGEYD
ncbi:MAG: hypothetical protein EPN33_02515 [Acidobacteria bacterium]|nr:MAG: hypothetical protein EPN33_02515 [Acidobacteriota bacterium]